MTEHGNHGSIENRLTKVEAHYDALSTGLSNGFDEIKAMIRLNQAQTRQELDALHSALDQRTKPQVAVWLQIVGVGITIAVITGGVFMQRIELGEKHINDQIKENYELYSELERDVREHHGDGHPHVVIERVKDTERRLDHIETKRTSEADPTQNERLRALEREVFGKGAQ